PALNEYTISGQIVTLGFMLDVTDYIDVDYLAGPLLFRPRCQTPIVIDGATTGHLPEVPELNTERIFMNGLTLKRVTGPPAGGEYGIGNDVLPFGLVIPGAQLWASYYGSGTLPTALQTGLAVTQLTGTTLQLPATPLAGLEAGYLNGLSLRRVVSAPGLGEYSFSGNVATLGQTVNLAGTDSAWWDIFV